VEGNAKLQGGASVATIGGSGAAGLAAEAVGAAMALLFNAASFLVPAACLLRIRTGAVAPAPARPAATVRTEIGLGYTANLALVVVFLVRVVGLLLATGGIGGMVGAPGHGTAEQVAGTARALVLNTSTGGLFGLLILLTGTGPRAAFYVVGSAVSGASLPARGSLLNPPAGPDHSGNAGAIHVFGTIPPGALPAGGLRHPKRAVGHHRRLRPLRRSC
jgi:hypothetical protein